MQLLSLFSLAVVLSFRFVHGAPAPPASSAAPAAGAISLKQTVWNPPAGLRNALDAVWDHEMKTYSPKPDPLKFKNYGYQQILANNGRINFCVRWDSKQTATPELRASINAALKKQTKKWTDILAGFDGWPYQEVPVKVVGWSARAPNLLPGYNETEGFRLYTDKDKQGVPQCAEACGRFFHQDNNYSKCPGGKDMHYDMSLWLTDGFKGGAGGDWGQRLSTETFVNDIKSKDSVHIFLHEMGHTFGLDDFYDWKPPGQTNFIMMAGSAFYITEFDAWMMRDWWRHLKSTLKLS